MITAQHNQLYTMYIFCFITFFVCCCIKIYIMCTGEGWSLQKVCQPVLQVLSCVDEAVSHGDSGYLEDYEEILETSLSHPSPSTV